MLQVRELCCPLPIPPSLPDQQALLEDEWEVLVQSSDLSMHASPAHLSKWLTKIRQCHVEAQLQVGSLFIFSVADPHLLLCGSGSGSRIQKMSIWIWILGGKD